MKVVAQTVRAKLFFISSKCAVVVRIVRILTHSKVERFHRVYSAHNSISVDNLHQHVQPSYGVLGATCST